MWTLTAGEWTEPTPGPPHPSRERVSDCDAPWSQPFVSPRPLPLVSGPRQLFLNRHTHWSSFCSVKYRDSDAAHGRESSPVHLDGRRPRRVPLPGSWVVGFLGLSGVSWNNLLGRFQASVDLPNRKSLPRPLTLLHSRQNPEYLRPPSLLWTLVTFQNNRGHQGSRPREVVGAPTVYRQSRGT